MTDKLKQFIAENRAAFDSEEQAQKTFINKSANPGKSKTTLFHYGKTLRWAAVVAGLILVSASIYWLMNKEKKEPEIALQPAIDLEEQTGVGDPAYAKQIYYFKELIGLKQEELKQLKKDYPELYNQFVGDINQLDSSYQELKTNLAKNPNREILLEAMIQNLQLQSELLNQQLIIIKEIKQKTKSHEKNNI